MNNVRIDMTFEEAQQLLNVLTQAPVPYAVSHGLVQKVGNAMARAQQPLQTEPPEPKEHDNLAD